MKYTEQEWDKFYHDLGKEFLVSPRVLQYVRNKIQQKYSDLTIEQALVAIRRDVKDRKMYVERTVKPMKLEVIHELSRKIEGLSTARYAVNKIESNMKLVLGAIDKSGYCSAIIQFTHRQRAVEQTNKLMSLTPKEVVIK